VIHVTDVGKNGHPIANAPVKVSDDGGLVLYERTDANGDVVTDKLSIGYKYMFEASAFGFTKSDAGVIPAKGSVKIEIPINFSIKLRAPITGLPDTGWQDRVDATEGGAISILLSWNNDRDRSGFPR